MIFFSLYAPLTAQKMKFFIKDFSSKCDQIHRKLGIWSHLLKKSLMENLILSAWLTYMQTPYSASIYETDYCKLWNQQFDWWENIFQSVIVITMIIIIIITVTPTKIFIFIKHSLREKFLVRIFLYSVWIRRFTP